MAVVASTVAPGRTPQRMASIEAVDFVTRLECVAVDSSIVLPEEFRANAALFERRASESSEGRSRVVSIAAR
jgi:hypothetical protein